jgi:DNA-binding HxlR family transcriptional regulator
MSLKDLAKNYPEYVSLDVFSLIQKLLGLEIRSDGSLHFDYAEGRRLGHTLNELIKAIFETLDNDDIRKELSQFIGQEVPNPLEEYVKACINEIENTKALDVLRLLLGNSYKEDELRDVLMDKGIIISEDELREALATLSKLGLISRSYGYWGINDRMKKHLEKYLLKE